MAKSKSTRAAKRGRAIPSFESEVKLYEDFVKQPAQLSKEQIEEIERTFTDDSDGMWRRAALASLGRSGSQLVEAANSGAEGARAIASVSVGVDSYIKRLKALLEMLESASVRCALALCDRQDMQTLLDLAKAEQEGNPGRMQ